MRKNVEDWERWVSVATGAGLVAFALTSKRPLGLAAAAAGAGLVFRGATGHCAGYQALGIGGRGAADTRGALGGAAGVNVKQAMTINRPVAEVYAFWRNLENLPTVMEHLESVRMRGANRSEWVARGPAGSKVSWMAETFNQVDNKLIAWRSLEGSQIVTAGSVNFREAPGGRGTEVMVNLQYAPPAGKAGAAVAWLFGEEPRQQVKEDLRRAKQFLEAGEIATTDGQPSGRKADQSRRAPVRAGGVR